MKSNESDWIHCNFTGRKQKGWVLVDMEPGMEPRALPFVFKYLKCQGKGEAHLYEIFAFAKTFLVPRSQRWKPNLLVEFQGLSFTAGWLWFNNRDLLEIPNTKWGSNWATILEQGKIPSDSLLQQQAEINTGLILWDYPCLCVFNLLTVMDRCFEQLNKEVIQLHKFSIKFNFHILKNYLVMPFVPVSYLTDLQKIHTHNPPPQFYG